MAFQTLISAILMISLFFISPPTRAEEKTAESSQPLTVEDVRETLEDTESADIGVQELLDLQKAGKVVIVDVRNPQHHAMSHIKGSINIPLTELTETTIATAVPDKKTPVAIMCDFSMFPTRMVPMTIQAFPVLKAAGYEKIYRLNLWQKKDGQIMSEEEIEKALPFEKQETTPTP